MSRIGQKPVAVPPGVTVAVSGNRISAKGPKGAITLAIPPALEIRNEPGRVQLVGRADTPTTSALQGLSRTLVANMMAGVAQGYTKELEIQGVGFKASVQGRKAVFALGFSSPKELAIPEGVDVKVTDSVKLVVTGPDKQVLGDFAARIKALYPAEPYKGKGIRFKGEYIRRKVGKTVA